MDESNGISQVLATQGVSPEWTEYAPLFGAALISALIPLFLFLLAQLIAKSSRGTGKAQQEATWAGSPKASDGTLGRRFNSRVFVPLAMAMLLVALGALMIPLAAALGPLGLSSEGAAGGSAAVLLCFLGVQALVALLYVAGKGDIRKLATYVSDPTGFKSDREGSKGEVI